jgi:hypothetical protein
MKIGAEHGPDTHRPNCQIHETVISDTRPSPARTRNSWTPLLSHPGVDRRTLAVDVLAAPHATGRLVHRTRKVPDADLRASLTASAYLWHRWAMKRPQDRPEHSKLYFWNTGFRVSG